MSVLHGMVTPPPHCERARVRLSIALGLWLVIGNNPRYGGLKYMNMIYNAIAIAYLTENSSAMSLGRASERISAMRLVRVLSSCVGLALAFI